VTPTTLGSTPSEVLQVLVSATPHSGIIPAEAEHGETKVHPQEYLSQINSSARRRAAAGETFEGFAVLGVSHMSGHTLALRHFPYSSVGPAFTSVWMREPGGDWRIFSNVPARVSCANYLRPALADQVEIHHEWLDESTLKVEIPALRFSWTIELTSSRTTSFMSAALSYTPGWMFDGRVRSLAISGSAQALLRAGKLRLRGFLPNGQRYVSQPKAVWEVAQSTVTVGDFNLGPVVRPATQHALKDFLIPLRPIAMVGKASFRPVATPVAGVVRATA
jgi:hypothetical protein